MDMYMQRMEEQGWRSVYSWPILLTPVLLHRSHCTSTDTEGMDESSSTLTEATRIAARCELFFSLLYCAPSLSALPTYCPCLPCSPAFIILLLSTMRFPVRSFRPIRTIRPWRGMKTNILDSTGRIWRSFRYVYLEYIRFPKYYTYERGNSGLKLLKVF